MSWIAFTLFIKNAFGFLVEHKRIISIAAAVVVIAFILFFAYKGCTKSPTVKIDTESAQKLNNANEAKRREELKTIIVGTEKVLDESKAVELENDKKIAKADDAIQKIRNEKRRDVTAEELEQILSGVIE